MMFELINKITSDCLSLGEQGTILRLASPEARKKTELGRSRIPNGIRA